MNQIQEAIARAVGLDNEFTGLRQTLEEQNGTLEHLIADNALLQREIEDLDYLNLYDISSTSEVLPAQQRKNVIHRLRRLRHENPLAKQAVKLTMRFTLGKGIQYTIAPDEDSTTPEEPEEPEGSEAPEAPEEIPTPKLMPPMPLSRLPSPAGEDDALTEIIESFWRDADNQRIFTSHRAMKEWLDDCYTDGERFFACFTAESAPYVKLADIPAEEIQLIVYHPDNRRVPLYYKRVFVDRIYSDESGYRASDAPKVLYYLDYGITDEQLKNVDNRVKIPGSKKADPNIRVFHSMPNPLWGKAGQRGISELYASREWFRVFKEFMEDRAAINAAATSVAYKRKIKGGPTAVAQFKNKFGGLDVGYDADANQGSEIKKLTRPTAAGIYDSNPAIDLEWMKTDTGAVNAKEDARMLLMAAGAGVGTNLPYFGEGGDANLATAQAMELPMVKSYEDWQEFVNQEILAMIRFVLATAMNLEEASDSIERVAIHFPPIITQDVVKYMTAWTQMVTSVAPGNQVVHREAIRGSLSVMGVPNIDRLMPLIDQEEQRVQAEKAVQKRAMLDNLTNPNPAGPNGASNSNGEKPGIGSTGGAGFTAKPPNRAMPPDLIRAANGRPPTERRGPRPI